MKTFAEWFSLILACVSLAVSCCALGYAKGTKDTITQMVPAAQVKPEPELVKPEQEVGHCVYRSKYAAGWVEEGK